MTNAQPPVVSQIDMEAVKPLIERFGGKWWKAQEYHLECAAFYAAGRLASSGAPEGWRPISTALPSNRYLGAFKAFGGEWQIVGPGRVTRDGVFYDSLGRWEPIDRILLVPDASLLAAAPTPPASDAHVSAIAAIREQNERAQRRREHSSPLSEEGK